MGTGLVVERVGVGFGTTGVRGTLGEVSSGGFRLVVHERQAFLICHA